MLTQHQAFSNINPKYDQEAQMHTSVAPRCINRTLGVQYHTAYQTVSTLRYELLELLKLLLQIVTRESDQHIWLVVTNLNFLKYNDFFFLLYSSICCRPTLETNAVPPDKGGASVTLTASQNCSSTTNPSLDWSSKLKIPATKVCKIESWNVIYISLVYLQKLKKQETKDHLSTSQATPQVKQTFKEAKKQITQHAEQFFEESKQASTPPSKVNSLKKAVPQQLKQLFEESSIPTTKATLRRKRKAPPEDTAFVNN